METLEINRRLERKVQQLQSLIDFGRALAGVVDPADVLRRLSLTLSGQWALRRYGVVAVREGRDPLVRQRGMSPLALGSRTFAGPGASGMASWRTPFRLEGGASDPLLSALRAMGGRAVIPLVSGETVLGFAVLGERPADAPFTDDDLEHASGLAAQAVVALEGAWQSQEASHWRRLSQAQDEWRHLEPLSRLVFLAVARLGPAGPLPGEEPKEAVRRLVVHAGATAPGAEITAALDRLVSAGALAVGSEGSLRVERESWLLLPETRQPLAEVARGTRRRVGAYELFERIGSGGMGDVYRAENVHDRTPAAVKLLTERIGDDEDLRDRFEREGAIVSQLSHPNIVRLLERGEQEGRLYLAMELLEGETLSVRMRRGLLGVEAAIDGLRALAGALAALHARGVVHRDVKASNVMLTTAGRWVLLDFGLARSLDETTRTREGALIGTLPYMSPERIRGGFGGKSADIWALGIVFYQMLLGRLPWGTKVNATLVVEISQTRPDVSEAEVVAGKEVARLLSRMLDPDPGTRLPDGAALADALDALPPVRRPARAAGSSVDADEAAPTQRLDDTLRV